MSKKRSKEMKDISEEDLTLTEEQLEDLYSWVDTIPLTRPKKNIARDFSDGVLVAEVVAHYLPRLVEIHNYPPANSVTQKMQNWYLLNRKVFSQMNFQLREDLLRKLSEPKTGVIEHVLAMLRIRIDETLYRLQNNKGMGRTSQLNDKPEADQNYSSGTVSPGRGVPIKKTTSGPLKGGKATAFSDSGYVPRILLEEKEQECLAKEETIQILNAKVKRLEHLLHLKDIRIEDLQGRIEQSRPTGKR